MNYFSAVAAVLIIMIFIHELKYYRIAVIRSIKTKFEIVATIIGVVCLVAITLIFANKWLHYVWGIIGITFILADVGKQGIPENGLLIIARGKELYRWEEIHHTDIIISDKVKIVYFVNPGSKIATQFYPVMAYDRIVELFQEHKVSFQIVQ